MTKVNASVLMDIFNELVLDTDAQDLMLKQFSEFNSKFEPNADPDLWVTLVKEEIYEFMDELLTFGFSTNLLKEYCDIIYTIVGTISLMGDTKFIETDKPEKLQLELWSLKAQIKEVTNVAWLVFTNDVISRGFTAVHTSNMSKLDDNGNTIRREDGKIMKGPNYIEADIQGLFAVKMHFLNTLKEELRV